jgi:hypothetical protein
MISMNAMVDKFKEIKRFLSFFNLQRKLIFNRKSNSAKFVDLYFRRDHSEFQIDISNEVRASFVTNKTPLAFEALIILAGEIFRVLILNNGEVAKIGLLQNIEYAYTKAVINKLFNGCGGELHSLAFDSMKYIIPICRMMENEKITTYEYQHGLIYWPTFSVEKPPPDVYVCASENDIKNIKKATGNSCWEVTTKFVKSDICENYVYGRHEASWKSSLDYWDGRYLAFIHSPIYINGGDISIILFDELLKNINKKRIEVRIFPHPSMKKSLIRKYGNKVSENGEPGELDLVVGFFSSKLLKCLREGLNVMQLKHFMSEVPFQMIPNINAVSIEDIVWHSMRKQMR